MAASDDPYDLVTVARYTDAIEANLARGRLEAEGIGAVVADDHYVWASWVASQSVGGVRVRVQRKDLDAAKAVIAAHDAGRFALDEPAPTCPRCGSQNSEVADLTRRIALLTLFWASLPLPWSRRRKCRQCGTVWREDAERG